jgi:hypothetical protein
VSYYGLQLLHSLYRCTEELWDVVFPIFLPTIELFKDWDSTVQGAALSGFNEYTHSTLLADTVVKKLIQLDRTGLGYDLPCHFI